MAEITITIADEYVQRILNAFDAMYPGRMIVDEETGEETELFTKPQWAKKQTARFVKEIVVAYEVREAMETARLEAIHNTNPIDVQ